MNITKGYVNCSNLGHVLIVLMEVADYVGTYFVRSRLPTNSYTVID